jgi:ankyrin repeat protein
MVTFNERFLRLKGLQLSNQRCFGTLSMTFPRLWTTPFYFPEINGHMDLNQAFFQAIQQGDQLVVEHLLDQQPSLVDARTEQGLSAVLAAMYDREPAIASLLVARGAKLDVFEAAATGQTEKLQALVAADPRLANATAIDGFQPLGLAAFFGHAEAARFLVESGASVNAASQNPQQVMPLHSAAAGEHLEIARLLLEAGAQVNARQAGEFTPLHSAAQNGQVEMVRLLLAHGADSSVLSQDGRTPADLAQEQGHLEVVEILKSSR